MTYQVETSEIAEAEIQALFLRLNGWNPDVAGRWLEGLLRAIDDLETFPKSHVVVPEMSTSGREVRRMLYKHGRTTYLILFTLVDTDDDGEMDTVRVVHVRHGAQGSASDR